MPSWFFPGTFRVRFAVRGFRPGTSEARSGTRPSVHAETSSGASLDRIIISKEALKNITPLGRTECRELPKTLARFKMRASMSRRGNCYDNAPIESFWGVLKNELVHHRRYETRRKLYGRSQRTSKSFTIGSDGRRGLVLSPCRL
jgi:hypothetical protein